MPGKAAGANGQCNGGTRRVGVQQEQRRRRPGFGRKDTRAPRFAQQFRREPHLRLDARQRPRQALTQRLFDIP